MYKKLVKYDKWHYAEIDPVRLRRTAIQLQEQIQKKIPVEDDRYQFHSLTMPFIHAAIKGEIHDSVDGDVVKFVSKNFKWDYREGNLPPEYDQAFTGALADFSVCLEGLSLEEADEVIKDGVTYRWLDLEEDGDWPDNVKYP